MAAQKQKQYAPLAFRSVQWYSKEEWKKVYLLIFGPNSNDNSKKEALQILNVWKLRSPHLPSGIESTLGLLEVDMQSSETGEIEVVSDRMLRLLYSSALMRFINHSLDDSQLKNRTLIQAAGKMNIPHWLINLRHETAHGHELPSLDILKSAVHFSLNWLHDSYWSPHYNKISNYYSKHQIGTFSEDFLKLMNLYNSLIIFNYKEFNISKISNIPNEEIRNNMIEDLKIVFDGDVDENISLKVSVNAVIKYMSNFIDQFSNIAHRNQVLVKHLTNSESLFMAGSIIDNSDNNKFVPLDGYCVSLWGPLLSLLHRKNIIVVLIRKLINLCNSSNEPTKMRRAAAQWIKEIALAFQKCNFIQSLNLDDEIKNYKLITNKNLRKILFEKDPNKEQRLILDLLHPIPKEIRDVNFVHNIVMNPHPYHVLYISDLLDIIEPKLPNQVRLHLLKVVDIYNANNFQHSNNNQIYTVDDIKEKNLDHTSNNPTDDGIDLQDLSSSSKKDSVWKNLDEDFEWGLYPIGTLPWQNNYESGYFIF